MIAVEPEDFGDKPFIVEVQENGSTAWIGNQLRFASEPDARAYGIDLFSRWFGIQAYRVIDTRTGEVVT